MRRRPTFLQQAEVDKTVSLFDAVLPFHLVTQDRAKYNSTKVYSLKSRIIEDLEACYSLEERFRDVFKPWVVGDVSVKYMPYNTTSRRWRLRSFGSKPKVV